MYVSATKRAHVYTRNTITVIVITIITTTTTTSIQLIVGFLVSRIPARTEVGGLPYRYNKSVHVGDFFFCASRSRATITYSRYIIIYKILVLLFQYFRETNSFASSTHSIWSPRRDPRDRVARNTLALGVLLRSKNTMFRQPRARRNPHPEDPLLFSFCSIL